MSLAVRVRPFDSFRTCSVKFEGITLTPAASAEGLVSDLDPTFGSPTISVDSCQMWERLTVSVCVTIDFNDLPDAWREDPDSAPISVLAVVRCNRTKVRRGFHLRKRETGEWGGSIDFYSNELDETAEAVILIVADKASGQIFSGGILFESLPLIVTIRKTDASDIEGGPRITWKDFTKEEGWLRERASDLFYVDTTDTPVIYLNSSIPNFRDLLTDEEHPPAFDALRIQTTHMIAISARYQIYVDSLDAIAIDEDGQVLIEGADWKTGCVELLAKTLYPEMIITDALKQCHEDLTERHSELLGRLLSISQESVKLNRGLAKCVAKARRAGDLESEELA